MCVIFVTKTATCLQAPLEPGTLHTVNKNGTVTLDGRLLLVASEVCQSRKHCIVLFWFPAIHSRYKPYCYIH